MKRIAGLGLCALFAVLLGGCSLLGLGPDVTLSLDCRYELVDGVGTDFDWRVAIDDERSVNSNSASGGSVTFENVGIGEHTLYFIPPEGCGAWGSYDQEVGSYTFDVGIGGEDLDIGVGDMDFYGSFAPSLGSKMSEN